MVRPPTHAGHGLNADDERWGARFSAVMLAICVVLIVVLLVLASQV